MVKPLVLVRRPMNPEDLEAAPREVRCTLSILYFRKVADVLIEFAHGKVDPAEAGAKGGRSS